jgi:hypothetical protein
VRLQIFSPAVSRARISLAIRRISEPFSEPAWGAARKGGPLEGSTVVATMMLEAEEGMAAGV